MTIIHLIDDGDPHICGNALGQTAKRAAKPMESIVKAILVASVALAALPIATPVVAETPEQAALAVVAPFYDGLNAAPGKDIEGVLQQATAPEWVSCGTNDVCGPREQVIPAIAGRLK